MNRKETIMNDIIHSETVEQRLAHEREFVRRIKDFKPLDTISHPSGVQKGDMVVVKNGYGCLVGPFKVLGFEYNRKGEACMYLDWDCYWYSTEVSNIVENRKGGAQ